MRSVMDSGDRFVYQPPSGNDAKLTIEYRLPRRDGGGTAMGDRAEKPSERPEAEGIQDPPGPESPNKNPF